MVIFAKIAKNRFCEGGFFVFSSPQNTTFVEMCTFFSVFSDFAMPLNKSAKKAKKNTLHPPPRRGVKTSDGIKKWSIREKRVSEKGRFSSEWRRTETGGQKSGISGFRKSAFLAPLASKISGIPEIGISETQNPVFSEKTDISDQFPKSAKNRRFLTFFDDF